jgi:bifunctional DNA-binding transcriptional regulator/antitoxin component of YhaV-PrlF toxin-antitoxin module
MTVTLKDKFQILVPPSLQRQAGFKLGDQIEFRASRGIITIVPKSAQETPLIKAFRATHQEANRQGLDKMTMKQINAEIAAHRKEKRKQQPKPRGE